MEKILKVLEDAYGINKQAAILTVGGYVVVSAAISLVQKSQDKTVTLWPMLGALVGLILFMMFLTQTPRIVRQLAGGLIALLASIWAAAVLASVLAPTTLKLPTTECIIKFNLAERCLIISAVPSGETPTKEIVTADTPISAPPPATAKSEIPVFIQFAGFQRGAIVDLAAKLGSEGWTVRGGDKGGERLETATGLSEVRYFNSADRPLAEALAANVSAAMSGSPSIALKDFSVTSFAKPPMNQIEIWISQ